ncbi:MAG: hypothetical protein ACKVYV_11780 [Limisphaerales bacterium]
MTAILSGKNQVTVPAALVQKLGLEPGARLCWQLGSRPRQLIVTVQPDRTQLLRQVRELGRRSRSSGDSAVAALIRERVEDDEVERRGA